MEKDSWVCLPSHAHLLYQVAVTQSSSHGLLQTVARISAFVSEVLDNFGLPLLQTQSVSIIINVSIKNWLQFAFVGYEMQYVVL
jgi:hypothetical protein